MQRLQVTIFRIIDAQHMPVSSSPPTPVSGPFWFFLLIVLDACNHLQCSVRTAQPLYPILYPHLASIPTLWIKLSLKGQPSPPPLWPCKCVQKCHMWMGFSTCPVLVGHAPLQAWIARRWWNLGDLRDINLVFYTRAVVCRKAIRRRLVRLSATYCKGVEEPILGVRRPWRMQRGVFQYPY